MYVGLILALVAAWSDLRSGVIPNRLTLPALALALFVSFLPGGTTPGESALGLALSALPSFVLFVTTNGRGIGGGDVKLLGALGAWMGPDLGLASQLAGLSFCAGWSAFRSFRTPKTAIARSERLGPFLFLGTLAAAVFDQC